jgi:septum formation protein
MPIHSSDLPLFRGLPRAASPTGEPFILASSSPRRRQLMEAAGYEFAIVSASDAAECGICSRETAPQLVARYAYRKAVDVVLQVKNRAESDSHQHSGLVIAADTVASCLGQILGKPQDAKHAETMLRMLSGRRHDVYSGLCLWSIRTGRCVVDVVRTELEMAKLSEEMLADYLDSMRWEGKAGAFGYQDGNDWLKVVGGGCETNVVGLPMHRLSELLEHFDSKAETVTEDIHLPRDGEC